MDAQENTKKYIRTLAGDMAILKGGGTPDLAPLVESKDSQTPEERLVAASPVVPIPVPIPPSAEELALKQEPSIAPSPEAEKTSPIETYSSDFSDRMKEKHASIATVLASEQDAAPQTQPTQKSSRSNIIYISAGGVFILASMVGAYFAYTSYSASIAPIILAPTISAPIFVDDREQISGTGSALVLAIEQSVNRQLASGAVRLLYMENATSTNNNIFATAFQESAPDILLRNLNTQGNMAGIININGKQSPFFIFSVASYKDTFSGMFSWESLMTKDLGALFPLYLEPVLPAPIATTTSATSTLATTTTKTATTTTKVATTGSTHSTSSVQVSSPQATTTATPAIPVFIAGFRDEVVSNHDVRVYRDAKNRSILLYGYWNQMTLIIARDPAAFAEILERFANSRV
jgi:hypothetical protein